VVVVGITSPSGTLGTHLMTASIGLDGQVIFFALEHASRFLLIFGGANFERGARCKFSIEAGKYGVVPSDNSVQPMLCLKRKRTMGIAFIGISAISRELFSPCRKPVEHR
jgi:hypothetical protein